MIRSTTLCLAVLFQCSPVGASSRVPGPAIPWPSHMQGLPMYGQTESACSEVNDRTECSAIVTYQGMVQGRLAYFRIAATYWTNLRIHPGDELSRFNNFHHGATDGHPTKFLYVKIPNSGGIFDRNAVHQQALAILEPFAADLRVTQPSPRFPAPGPAPVGIPFPALPSTGDPQQDAFARQAWENWQRMINQPMPQPPAPVFQPPPPPPPPPPPTGPSPQQIEQMRMEMSRRLPLMVRAGDLQGVQRLLANGANPNQLSIDEPYAPCVSLAIQKGRGDIIGALFQAGARADLGDRVKGRWPLFWAIMMKQPELVLWLLQNGKAGNINGIDASGMTPLMVAAQFGDALSIRYLLQYGADPNLQNVNTRPDHRQVPDPQDGWTALYYTQFARCPPCGEALRMAGGR